ncbi:MAG: hypothetical protein F4W92_01235 [Gammaproteobacteria bacterium]|nr:hypothetical protein [Gammaproteobacteria bacterium]
MSNKSANEARQELALLLQERTKNAGTLLDAFFVQPRLGDPTAFLVIVSTIGGKPKNPRVDVSVSQLDASKLPEDVCWKLSWIKGLDEAAKRVYPNEE